MLVSNNQEFSYALRHLRYANEIGLDTETSGLRPYHGDRLFSLVMVTDEDEFYFNFQKYPDMKRIPLLSKSKIMRYLQGYLFSEPKKLFYAHNAKFDLHMLAQENCFIQGEVHCTQAIGRVVYNANTKYDLAASLERIGMQKDSKVEDYIDEHHLWDWESIPGKKQREKRKHYDQVPFDIIVPYAIQDAKGTLALGRHQTAEIKRIEATLPDKLPKLSQVVLNEKQLTHTVFRMEITGCRIDPDYCKEAIEFYSKNLLDATSQLEIETGEVYVGSAKYFERIFKGHEKEFTLSKKRGFSFDADALKKITHPMVPQITEIRKIQNRLSFFYGFIYHADSSNIIHASFNPDLTRHGRFSSSGPNLTNLASNEEEDLEDKAAPEKFHVRRAIIPRDGNILLMPDWSAFEYRMALEYACRLAGRVVPLAQMVLDGMDFHDATIQVVKDKGYNITRRVAKVANFLTLYSGGPKALSENLGISLEEARGIYHSIRSACPEIIHALKEMEKASRIRGFVFNWLGRQNHFPDKSFCYKSGNYVISGGCADIAKIAMNQIDSYCAQFNNVHMIAMIHDEIILDVKKKWANDVARGVHQIMQTVFPHEYMPMVVDMAWSDRSLADKVKGFPLA